MDLGELGAPGGGDEHHVDGDDHDDDHQAELGYYATRYEHDPGRVAADALGAVWGEWVGRGDDLSESVDVSEVE